MEAQRGSGRCPGSRVLWCRASRGRRKNALGQPHGLVRAGAGEVEFEVAGQRGGKLYELVADRGDVGIVGAVETDAARLQHDEVAVHAELGERRPTGGDVELAG